MKGLAEIVDSWGGRTLLTLSEVPSFEGELKIRLVRKLRLFGPSQFFVLCTKGFPLNLTDVRLFFGLSGSEDRARAAEAKGLFRSLRWQLQVSDSDISTLSQLLEEVPQQKMPAQLVLDGTTYKLSFGRGLRKRELKWLSDAPRGWEALSRIKEALIRLAEVHAQIDSLDWKRKIELLSEVDAAQRELREQQRRQKLESIKRNNEACRRIADEFQDRGLTCPHCDHHTGIRYIERGSDTISFFVCRQCGRSFRAADFPGSPND
jgi:hypothetical protein